MMRNANVAEEAAKMSDGELAATIATYQAEQQRRDFKKRHGDANPVAVEIAKRHHERLYGGHDGSLSTF